MGLGEAKGTNSLVRGQLYNLLKCIKNLTKLKNFLSVGAGAYEKFFPKLVRYWDELLNGVKMKCKFTFSHLQLKIYLLSDCFEYLLVYPSKESFHTDIHIFDIHILILSSIKNVTYLTVSKDDDSRF